MVSDAERHLRADAARNAERIVRAARTAFADDGPDVSLEEIARRAGVGIRTLYRHFPRKADLARAVLDQGVAESLTPAIEEALADEDPVRGFTRLLEVAMAMVAREMNSLAAARAAGSLTADLSKSYFAALTLLVQRAQQAGLIRDDIDPDDLPRIMAMLVSVLWSTDVRTDGWRRYLTLILDALKPTAASALQQPSTPAAPPQLANWPFRPPNTTEISFSGDDFGGSAWR